MKKTFGKRLICAFISILMVMMLLPTGVFAESYELITEVAITSFSNGTYLLDVIDDVRAALSGGGYMEIDAEADSTGGAWFQVGVSDSTWAWGSTASSVTWLNAGDSQTVTVTSSDFAKVADFDDAWTAIYVQGGSTLNVTAIRVYGVAEDSDEEEDTGDPVVTIEADALSSSSGMYLFYSSDIMDIIRTTIGNGGHIEIDVAVDTTSSWFIAGITLSDYSWSSSAASVSMLDADTIETVVLTSSQITAVADLDDAWTGLYVMGEDSLNVTQIRVYDADSSDDEDADDGMYDVIVSETENGTVTTEVTEAAEGDTVYMTIIPDDGYMVGDYYVAYEDTIVLEYWSYGDNLYSFTMPAADATIYVTFIEEEAYTVTTICGENGTVITETKANEGYIIIITPTADEGYTVSEVSVVDSYGNTVSVNKRSDGTYTFIMPDSDVTVSVTFADLLSTIVARAEPVTYNGHTYQILYAEGLTWEEMEEYCEQLGGYLACITTADENEFLYEYVAKFNGGYSTMFGFTDAEEEGTWVWVSGEETDYTNWADGEPNNEYTNATTGENYANYYYKNTDGTWNDTDPSKQDNNFLIEWPYVDEEGTIPDITVVPTYVASIGITGEGRCSYGGMTLEEGDTFSFSVIPNDEDSIYTVSAVDDSGNELDISYVDTGSIWVWDYEYNEDGSLVVDENGYLVYNVEEKVCYNYELVMPASNVTVTIAFHSDDDHIWDDGVVTTEATCTTDGVMTYTCTVCGETYTEVIEATGHTEEETQENIVEAKCTTDGSYDLVVKCSVCGEELSRETIAVPATGHTPGEAVKENIVEATDEVDGFYELAVYCTECGEEISRETVVVPAGHEWDDGKITIAPTCTTAGVKTYTCTTCGETYTESVPATGHTAGTVVIENYVKVTADADGSYDLVTYCASCGEEISRSHTVIAAYGTGSAEVIDWATVLANANSSNATNTTVEDVVIEEPIEPTDTETEDDGEEEPAAEPAIEAETPAETNPTTGVVISLIPMAIAALAAVSSKRR